MTPARGLVGLLLIAIAWATVITPGCLPGTQPAPPPPATDAVVAHGDAFMASVRGTTGPRTLRTMDPVCS